MAQVESLKLERTTFKSRITRRNNWNQSDGLTATVELMEEKLKTMREKFVAALRHLIGSRTQPAPQASQQHQVSASYPSPFNMRLPEIPLNKFDGSFEKYRELKDQFNARLLRSIDKVIRLQYLQSLVIGEAHQVIEALETIAENYGAAWALLDKKYDIPRQDLRRHCSLLLNVGKRSKESNKSLTDLVNFLDDDRVFQWETHIEGNDMPKYEQLLDFLEKRGICAKSSAESSRHNKQRNDQRSKKYSQSRPSSITASPQLSTSKAQTSFTNTPRKCPICDQDHRIYECPKLNAINVDYRVKLIFKQGRCLNCLSRGHGVKEYTSKGFCRICNDSTARHHSLLHRDVDSFSVPQTPNP
ncbi:uncharacterized protein LOC135169141 [Diachasmimorpha longicaudata]|uniref:uncharacterized protein LOC135169141 n=1 Tax=Diachasmimorpha longicaudata TaxID=58733 RepID=UPI0030B90E38